MVKKKLSWKSYLLNGLALTVTVLPILTMGYWAVSAFQGDGRKLVALSAVEQTSNPKLFEEPIVSVTFDDGWQSVYTNAAPILSKYGIATTQYILPGQFNAPAYMSVQQAKHLQQTGHEIASHTYMHLKMTDLDMNSLTFELKNSHDALVKGELAATNMNFAPPYGAYDARTDTEVKKYYGSQRNVNANLFNGVNQADVNIKDYFNRYDIIGYTVGPYTKTEHIKEALDYARKNNGWLVLVYHQIESDFQPDARGDSFNVTPTDFEEQLKVIKQSGIKISTVAEVLGTPKVGN